ncbi:MAG: GAF domain-containing protein [Bacteroidales bacterium]|nr:GAF domain-containing protein [Bacteroidales bacterium]
MKLRLTIANKISLGFGSLMVVVIIAGILIYNTMQKNLELSHRISELYLPSAKAVNDLALSMTNSKMLIVNWVAERKNTEYKKQLIELHKSGYNKLIGRLDSLSQAWDKEDIAQLDTIKLTVDKLFAEHRNIMEMLKTPEDYNNPVAKSLGSANVEEGQIVMVLTDDILKRLALLSKKFDTKINSLSTLMNVSFDRFKNFIVWITVISFFLIIIVAFIYSRALVYPINKIKRDILLMSQGRIPDEILYSRYDEIGEMGHALNNLKKGLKKITQFANEIGKENYESEFTPLSKEDELGNSLLLMRENLKKASQEASLRRAENAQRSWASQGLAEFGVLLRESKDDLEELTNKILTRLVRYLGASIGGLFIINDDDENDTHLELLAFYAYDRRKYLNKRVEIGENLVGQCVLENETIYMNDIPKDYVHISSGLGKDDPKSLLIVPLKLNEKVYGVVELASFEEFEPYKIEFVEKIGESIASTISSVKINIHTAKLLQESNEKSERLTKQEEETRRQIEEMQKSLKEIKEREEKLKKENIELFNKNKEEVFKLKELNSKIEKEMKEISAKYSSIMDAVDNSVGTYYLSFSGEIMEANDRFIKMTGVGFSELKDRKLDDFMSEEKIQSVEHQNFMSDLLSGRVYRNLNQYYFDQKEKWFYETFTPLYDENDKFSRVISMAFDMTENVERERELRAEVSRANEIIKKLKDRML